MLNEHVAPNIKPSALLIPPGWQQNSWYLNQLRDLVTLKYFFTCQFFLGIRLCMIMESAKYVPEVLWGTKSNILISFVHLPYLDLN